MNPVPRRLVLPWLAGLAILSASCSTQTRRGPDVIDADAPKDFSLTDSGLNYRILRKGNGRRPTASSTVTVDYSGWLDNGTIFDSSYERREPATFSLSQVIPAWTEGMQLVSEGGMIELNVPANLGYGAQGMPPAIPPNSTLHFKVELHDFE